MPLNVSSSLRRLLALLVLAVPAPIAAQPAVPDGEDEFSASGYDQLRIEQEDKITVPLDQAEEVWQFLRSYLVDNQAALERLDPDFTASWSEEYFADTYFDTPSLQMLAGRDGVRHRRRLNLINDADVKSGRQLMQIKVNNIDEGSGNALERGEIKFRIKTTTGLRGVDDTHPFLGRVHVSHRELLKRRLRDMGIDPYQMRPILTVHDIRRRIYIRKNGQSFMSISVDNAVSDVMWARWQFVEIEPELAEINYTEADESTREYMTAVNEKISELLMTRFPGLRRDLTPKYNKAFAYFEEQIPMYRTLIAYEMDTVDSVVLGLLAAGLVPPVTLLAFWRRRSGDRQRMNEARARLQLPPL